MQIVDAHHHLWDLSRGRYPWLQQDYDADKFFLGDYRPLCTNFLPADFCAAAGGCDVLATVHVEAERDRAEQVAETAWLHEQHAAHGFPNAIVAHAWLDQPETEERLREHLKFPLVRGIRSKPVTSSSPDESVQGQRGTMQDDNWLRGLALLPRLGLSWDLRVPYWHLAEAAEVAAQLPKLPIVLNHHGFAWDRSEQGLKHWRDAMAVLARQPNVHVKLSEFGLRDRPWSWEDNAYVVRETLAIFGWERCMFASNFPVAGLRIGYGPLVQGMLRMLDGLPLEQRCAVMGGNALRFYRIDTTTTTTTTTATTAECAS
ncbi:amidohydrolase [Ramlibacter sp. WS9]|uniref:amidohydrolase family protein n=1 Tax=Ramlibacter sp. WS9 TaxID=1882741 RepID=UPI001141BEC2|nr:amidohydrolase family protein [Ramlibacter sp. WS9]ROZ69600.1 amidohydrolase [Ramlibacter sp. WS9]